MCDEKEQADITSTKTYRTVLIIFLFAILLMAIIATKYRHVKINWVNLLHCRVNEFSNCIPNVIFFIIGGTTTFIILYTLHSRPDYTVCGWEPNKSRIVEQYIRDDQTTTLISPLNSCPQYMPPNILIVVCSSPDHKELRNSIRSTWASPSYSSKYNFSVVFLLGVDRENAIDDEIVFESDHYRDIIVENVVDVYNNLTLKSILMLKWVKHNCNHVKFFMKADDDVYINVRRLSHYVDSVEDARLSNFLVGKLYYREKPIMDPDSKWYMPCYMYSDRYYPSYICGVGYLMATNVAMRLYNESYNTDMLHIEDVFITGLCAKSAGIVPHNEIAFHFFDNVINVQCNTVHPQLILLSHRLKPAEMFQIHRDMKYCIFSDQAH